MPYVYLIRPKYPERTTQDVTVLRLDAVPSEGQGVCLPAEAGDPPGTVRYVVDRVTHYPLGDGARPEQRVEVELRA